VHLIVSTQYALTADFPSTFLANLTARVCHRMGTLQQYATALAADQTELKTAGVEPIPPDQPGVCYTTGIPGIPDFTRCRTDHVTDPMIDQRAAETAHLRWPGKAILNP